MNKAQREPWLRLAATLEGRPESTYDPTPTCYSLCYWCRFGVYNYDHMACEHPLTVVNDRVSEQMNDSLDWGMAGDCWAFRPERHLTPDTVRASVADDWDEWRAEVADELAGEREDLIRVLQGVAERLSAPAVDQAQAGEG